MKKITVEDLQKMPKLKNTLINYVMFMYQENAIITDDYLVMEYNMLVRENRLDELFYQELLDNTPSLL